MTKPTMERNLETETKDIIANCSSNLSDDEVDNETMNRLRGDAIGETMYSERFVISTLMKLLTPESQEGEQFEKDLCTLWDMTIEKDVVQIILSQDFLDLVIHCLLTTSDFRLKEMLVGIVGNMCIYQEAREELREDECAMKSLLSLLSCGDTPTILQVLRLISNILKQEEMVTDYQWFKHFAEMPNFVSDFSFLLINSLNKPLLYQAIDTLYNILSKLALFIAYIEDKDTDDDVEQKNVENVKDLNSSIEEVCSTNDDEDNARNNEDFSKKTCDSTKNNQNEKLNCSENEVIKDTESSVDSKIDENDEGNAKQILDTNDTEKEHDQTNVSTVHDIEFWEVFVNEELIKGVCESFKTLEVIRDDSLDSDGIFISEETRKIVSHFINIHVILTANGRLSRNAYQPSIKTLLECLQSILEHFTDPACLFPLTFYEFDLLENINDIFRRLNIAFDLVCLLHYIDIWVLSTRDCKEREGKLDTDLLDDKSYQYNPLITDGKNMDEYFNFLNDFIVRSILNATDEQMVDLMQKISLKTVEMMMNSINHINYFEHNIEGFHYKLRKFAKDLKEPENKEV